MAIHKQFKLRKEDIKQLIPDMGSCFATDHITVEGLPVGYMYREAPDNDVDSGWRFFSAKESQEYVEEASHISIYDVNTIANYDPTILPYLNSPADTHWERIAGTSEFQMVDD